MKLIQDNLRETWMRITCLETEIQSEDLENLNLRHTAPLCSLLELPTKGCWSWQRNSDRMRPIRFPQSSRPWISGQLWKGQLIIAKSGKIIAWPGRWWTRFQYLPPLDILQRNKAQDAIITEEKRRIRLSRVSDFCPEETFFMILLTHWIRDWSLRCLNRSVQRSAGIFTLKSHSMQV